MSSTYEPIATTTLGSSQQTITFTSIPATYTDLVFVCSAKQDGTATSTGAFVRFNSDTGTNYSDTSVSGNGTSASSGRNSNTNGMYILNPNDTVYGTFIFNIQNYANTNIYKTTISRQDIASSATLAIVYLWRSTSAINNISITATDSSGGVQDNFVSGSTFTLYGIKAE
jgi:hypothetical protein